MHYFRDHNLDEDTEGWSGEKSLIWSYTIRQIAGNIPVLAVTKQVMH